MRSDQRHVDRRGAAERHARVLQVIAASTEPIAEKAILEKLRTKYTRREVDSSIVSLRRYGKIEVAVSGCGGHSSNFYRTAAERKVANG
jgi:hypothetical protein